MRSLVAELSLWLVCFFTDIHYSCSSSRHSLRSLPRLSFVPPTAAASACLHQPGAPCPWLNQPDMVNRKDAPLRSARWCLYFPRTHHTRKWKRLLREVVESGRAGVIFRDLSNLKVHLVWPQAVTFKSAARLVQFRGPGPSERALPKPAAFKNGLKRF